MEKKEFEPKNHNPAASPFEVSGSTSFAPGKIIIFGEHAVVYGRPAIAVPVTKVGVFASVEPLLGGEDSRVVAPLVGLDAPLHDLAPDHHLVRVVTGAANLLGVTGPEGSLGRPFTLKITGNLPVAAGMGSGAAVSVATIRALANYWKKTVSDEDVNALTFEIEKIHHGTPSGIDNTVVTYARPVFFIRGQPIQTFTAGRRFRLLIADTGVSSSTAVTVGDVRKEWKADPVRFERLFDKVGEIAREAKTIIETGGENAGVRLGTLMNQNQTLLEKMGVSSEALERLTSAANDAGALGAKLSGGGRGGNTIALVEESTEHVVSKALKEAGAVRIIETEIGNNGRGVG